MILYLRLVPLPLRGFNLPTPLCESGAHCGAENQRKNVHNVHAFSCKLYTAAR